MSDGVPVGSGFEIPLPPGEGADRRLFRVLPGGLVEVPLAEGGDTVRIPQPNKGFTRPARELYPQLHAFVADASKTDDAKDLTEEELDWHVAELVLWAPTITRDLDGRDASDGYAFEELVLETEKGLMRGAAIREHDSTKIHSDFQPVRWVMDHAADHKDDLPPPNTAWDEWTIPRLVTETSLHFLDTGNRTLHKPRVTAEFFRVYIKNFLPRIHRVSARRFLGKSKMPTARIGGFGFPADSTKTLDDLIGEFDKATLSQRLPKQAERDEWFVDRVLNGMHPCLFTTRGAGDDTTYCVRFEWNAFPFAPVIDRREEKWHGHDREKEKTHYELPNAEAVFKLAGHSLVPHHITLRHRKRAADGGPLPGPVNETDMAELERYTPDDPNWSYAKRAFRCQLAMAGELDEHLAGAHLMLEQILAALATVEGMAPSRADQPGHPLWALLWPHIRYVDRINAFGDELILGERGVMAQATALSNQGATMRTLEQMGRRDWADFTPRKSLCATHRYATAANACWDAIQSFVCEWLHTEEVWDDFEEQWDLIEQAGATLSAYSPRHRPYRTLRDGERWAGGADNELAAKNEGEPSMSPLPKASDSEAVRRKGLIQFCTFTIYHATFVHTWTNDRQVEDLGDARFASLGLMTHEPPSSSPPDEAWEKKARPVLRDAGFTMALARILSRMHTDFVLSDKECDGARYKSPGRNPVHDELRAKIHAIKRRYEGGRDPFNGVRQDLDQARVCALRSQIDS